VPTTWFDIIYWATLISTSLISGLMIVVILMLYNAVTNLIAIIGLDKDNEIVHNEETKEELEDKKDEMKNDE